MSYGEQRDPKKSVPRKLPASEPPKRPPTPQPAEDEYAIRPTDEYAIRAEPAAPPVPLPVPRVREPVVTHDPVPEPPTLAFWSGIFSFPFYLKSLGAWLLIAMGLTVGAVGMVFCLWLSDTGQTLALRCFLLPVLMIIAFTCCYASAVCQTITQLTAEGYDGVEDWPRGDWREWAWTVTYPLGMFLPAALMGWVVQWLVPLPLPIPGVFVAFVAFPVLLLSALEAGSPTMPVSLPVLNSLVHVWWGWALFYLESGALVSAWAALVYFGYLENPWLTAALGAPLLAAVGMIYARLLGRLAWYIDRQMAQRADAEDED